MYLHLFSCLLSYGHFYSVSLLFKECIGFRYPRCHIRPHLLSWKWGPCRTSEAEAVPVYADMLAIRHPILVQYSRVTDISVQRYDILLKTIHENSKKNEVSLNRLRRYLRGPMKVASSAHEGIFMKMGQFSVKSAATAYAEPILLCSAIQRPYKIKNGTSS